jgi:uncharacterized protein (DUF2062 family)
MLQVISFIVFLSWWMGRIVMLRPMREEYKQKLTFTTRIDGPAKQVSKPFAQGLLCGERLRGQCALLTFSAQGKALCD